MKITEYARSPKRELEERLLAAHDEIEIKLIEMSLSAYRW